MDVNKKVEFIKKWILDYVNSMPSKAQCLVIGISGGIDSSVSSTLSAMTGLKTIVLSMPIKQIHSQHDLSLKHQEWLVKNFKLALKAKNNSSRFIGCASTFLKFLTSHS